MEFRPIRPSLFRPEAQDGAAAIQELDEPLAMLRPRHLVAGLLLATVLAGTLLWAVQAEVPVKVHGQGVLVAPAGITDVFSDGDGRLERLLVAPGDRVAAGQPVAVVEQGELRLQLRAAEGQLADALTLREELSQFHRRDAAADEAWRAARDAALEQSLAAAQERRQLTAERQTAMVGLAGQSLVSHDRALAARVELYNVRDQIEQMRNERRTLSLDSEIKRTQREREILAADQRVSEARRAVTSLAARLDHVGTVLAPDAGRIVEVKAAPGQAVARGTPVLTLARSREGGAEVPQVLVYVSAEDGKKLRAGMVAEVSPSTTRREEHGFLRGQVDWVADTAASSAGMGRTLQNDQLVRNFTQRLGTPFELRIRLEADPAGSGGLAWSTGRGPGFGIDNGTMAEVAVSVRRVRLLALAIPALQRWLD
jgi:HlyD family secretion protein